MHSPVHANDRRTRIRSWLSAEPRNCLLLLPDHLESPHDFADAVGLSDAELCILCDGCMRLPFEPHPRFVSGLRTRDVRDIVLVATTDRSRPGRANRRHATAFLERQLDRLLEYRTGPSSARLPPEVQVHGWLWDREQTWLAPYSWEARDLDVEVQVRLPPEAVDEPVSSRWVRLGAWTQPSSARPHS